LLDFIGVLRKFPLSCQLLKLISQIPFLNFVSIEIAIAELLKFLEVVNKRNRFSQDLPIDAECVDFVQVSMYTSVGFSEFINVFPDTIFDS
jgi:hypothetical protein